MARILTFTPRFLLYFVLVYRKDPSRISGSGSGPELELSVLHKNITFAPLRQDDEDTLETSTDDSTVDSVSATDKNDEISLDKSHNYTETTSTAVKSASPFSSWTALHESFLPTFPLEEAFPVWTVKVWQHWGVFLELGMPGALSLFLEWGSYELMAMIAGQLGTVELATHGVYMSTCAILYMMPQAISDATAVIAGNYLGHGDPQEAKSVIKLGIFYDMGIGLLSASLLLFVLRPYWGGIFSSDPAVQAEVYAKLPIMFVYVTIDSMKCVSLNVLRSTGRPQITMVGNILCCVCVMLPLGWYWAITLRGGLTGVWGAMTVGWACATLLYLTVLFLTDWEEQARLAAKRNAVEQVVFDAEESKNNTEESEVVCV